MNVLFAGLWQPEMVMILPNPSMVGDGMVSKR
jgi:hypothetical protein